MVLIIRVFVARGRSIPTLSVSSSSKPIWQILRFLSKAPQGIARRTRLPLIRVIKTGVPMPTGFTNMRDAGGGGGIRAPITHKAPRLMGPNLRMLRARLGRREVGGRGEGPWGWKVLRHKRGEEGSWRKMSKKHKKEQKEKSDTEEMRCTSDLKSCHECRWTETTALTHPRYVLYSRDEWIRTAAWETSLYISAVDV